MLHNYTFICKAVLFVDICIFAVQVQLRFAQVSVAESDQKARRGRDATERQDTKVRQQQNTNTNKKYKQAIICIRLLCRSHVQDDQQSNNDQHCDGDLPAQLCILMLNVECQPHWWHQHILLQSS